VALAAAAAAALILEAQLRGNGSLPAGAYVLALAAAAPLGFRAVAPLPALVAVELGALLCAAVFSAGWSATVLVLLALYTVALHGDRLRSLAVGAVTGVAVALAVVLIDSGVELTGIALRVALVFAAVVLGEAIRSRGALRAAARERARIEQREREEEAKRRAGAERLRIAQELHDTLAHSLVAMNVRASVALDLGESQDPTAALQDIKAASADALRDLRSTLGLLRGQGEPAPTTPGHDLDALPGLVEHARAAGLNAALELRLNGAVVPAVVGAAAYRIVQEALTNVLRHANAASACVELQADGERLNVEITDDGSGGASDASPGLGLQGMAERSAALGGHLHAGPSTHGGWHVHATFPLGCGLHR
jgi:signal transduction histidine kinase